MDNKNVQRLPAEQLFQNEIDALIANEKNPIPTGWRMSPKSVLTYICGGTCGGVEITPKYIGHKRLVEIAISTLVTDRALCSLESQEQQNLGCPNIWLQRLMETLQG